MGAADFAWADALRRRHFPPERNRVPAHITLFHHLPPSAEAELMTRMEHFAKDSPPVAHLTGLLNLGRGVAYRVESPQLLAIRADIAAAFHGLLTAQDNASPRLHLTIQNKVPPPEARALLDSLSAGFSSRPLRISGLAAWAYLDGPWRLIREIRFRG